MANARVDQGPIREGLVQDSPAARVTQLTREAWVYVCQPPAATYNFNYIKSFPLTSGAQYSVALDAGGVLWQEDVVNYSNALTPIATNITPGTYMFSTTQSDYEYMCFSNLTNGTDVPRQYNPQPATGGYTLDRISQVGPGAPPTFQATLLNNAGSSPITSWAGVGSVVTFQAVNAFTAGEVVRLTSFTVSTFFNNRVFSVLGTGLSGTQFQVSFAGFSGGSDTGKVTPQYGYPVSGITQVAKKSDPQSPGHFQALLWSAGPGQTSAGNVITVYYANQSEGQAQDADLANAFNSGQTVYVYISSAPFGNGTFQVNSIGAAKPPGGDGVRWYFTFQAASSNYQFFGGPDDAAGFYQQTAATIVVGTPIPNISTGAQITISGASPSSWNATWTVTNALQSGVYTITGTSMTNGTATYQWTWAGNGTAVAPIAGQLVTVSGTLNGNNVFNVSDATIASVAGGPSSGSFTIANFPNQTITASTTESGQAQTSGTKFIFDPGQTTLGTTTSPIFGNASANLGTVTIIGATAAGTTISAGTRQGVVYFETRNGLKTACSSPATFTTPDGTSYILADHIPIGPPDVIRRWIAFTPAGPNGIPGPNFYSIDAPVSYTVNNQTYLYSATYIDDNVTTTAKFTFPDSVLLAGEAIDVQSSNLFNLIELGSSAWNIAYASRMFYGGEQNKVLNFTNLSFDGGFLPNPNASVYPLGWGSDAFSNQNIGTPVNITAFQITSNVVTFTATNTFQVGEQAFVNGMTVGTYLNKFFYIITAVTPTTFTANLNSAHANVGLTADAGGSAVPFGYSGNIVVSPVFGDAYQIVNSLASTQSQLGMILQSAYQDAYNVPIILPNTLYSVRVAATGAGSGNLIIDLTEFDAGIVSGATTFSGYGTTFGTFSVPFSSMSPSAPRIFSGTLLTTPFTTGVPVGLKLRLWAQNIGDGAGVTVDRLEVFPTAQPNLSTNVRVSYVDNFEAFDAVTGNIGLSSHNTQAAMGAFELHDQLYFLQTGSMQVTQDVGGTEPSGPGGGWPVHEVSNRVGTCGIHAYDYGEEWVLTACRNGVFGFNGGQPIRIDFQQKEIWEELNWAYGKTIWLKNDLPNRKIYVGVPLPTPNKWLPLAPVNKNPTTPNVILMWNWQGLNDFQELVDGQSMHTTMFGTLASVDMRLKMTIWNVASPYAGFITQPDLTTQRFTICNGNGSGKIYQLYETGQLIPDHTDPLSDDGTAINSQYWTYGFVNSSKAQQFPLLGFHRKRYQMVQQLISGAGTAVVKAYPNYILTESTLAFNDYAYTVPGGIGLVEQPKDDYIRPLNISGNRVYVQYGTNAVGEAWNLSKVIMCGTVDGLSTVNPNAG